MCNPAMIMGAQGFAAATDTVGDIFAAIGQRDALRSQARIAEFNAQTIDEAARRSRERGNFEETKSRLAYANLKSKQRAAMGANGVALDEGSALTAQVSTDYISETDAINIQKNAIYEAHGYQMAATGERMGATMKRAQASGISPLLTGVISGVTNAGKVASSWYALDRVGAFDKPPATTGKSSTTGGTGDTKLTGQTPFGRGTTGWFDDEGLTSFYDFGSISGARPPYIEY